MSARLSKKQHNYDESTENSASEENNSTGT